MPNKVVKSFLEVGSIIFVFGCGAYFQCENGDRVTVYHHGGQSVVPCTPFYKYGAFVGGLIFIAIASILGILDYIYHLAIENKNKSIDS